MSNTFYNSTKWTMAYKGVFYVVMISNAIVPGPYFQFLSSPSYSTISHSLAMFSMKLLFSLTLLFLWDLYYFPRLVFFSSWKQQHCFS